MRELFVDELAAVTGGGTCPVCTTLMCCEEGPYDACCWYEAVKDVVEDLIP